MKFFFRPLSVVGLCAVAVLSAASPGNGTTGGGIFPRLRANLPAITPPTTIVQGIYFKEYGFAPANGGDLPNFATIIPRHRGILGVPTADSPPLPVRANNDNFCLLWTGYVQVPSAGTWTFYTNSDDGSRLLIDGVGVVTTNDGPHGTVEQPGTVDLDAGYHAIRVEFAEGGGGFHLDVKWRGPGGVPAQQLIPATSLFTEAIVATPTITPTGGAGVTIASATPGSVIYYTLDGSLPDVGSATGAGLSPLQISLSGSATINAIASRGAMNTSDIATAVVNPTLPARVLSTVASVVNTNAVVTFNRPVTAPTAIDFAANYSIDNGVTISGATLMTRPGALSAYWKLDDTTGTDSSPNGNTAAVVAATQDAAQKPFNNFINPASANGASLDFNGSTATFIAPNSPSLDFNYTSFTVAAWIRPADVSVARHILNKWTDAATPGWYLSMTAGGGLKFRLRTSLASDDSVTTATSLLANATWAHVAVRVDRQFHQITVYVNGIPVAGPSNFNTAARDVTNAAGFALAAPADPADGVFFSGKIDDVRLYRVSLTNGEVGALFNASDGVSSSVRLTTSALAPATTYTLTVKNVQDTSGQTIPASGVTSQFVFTGTGAINYEQYNGIGGVQVPDLTQNAAFPGNPAINNTKTSMEGTLDFLDNYGVRMKGFFVPPSTGNHYFAISTDDNGKFWISTDEDPANKILVALENVWNGNREFQTGGGGGQVQSSATTGPLLLTAGQKYYIEAYMKEGGGGDNIAVAVSSATPIANGTAPIGDAANLAFPSATLAPYADLPLITTQPLGRVVTVGGGVTFSVTAGGTGPFTYQWFKGGVSLGAGATGVTFNIPATVAGDSGNYSVAVTNGSGSTLSSAAVLIVNDLSALPTVTAVNPSAGPLAGGTAVTVTGTNFVPNQTTVLFGGASGTPATSVIVTSGTTLTCVTPAHAAGAVAVQVSTEAGYATLLSGFTYFAAPTVATVSPNAGPLAGAITVTISGTNFSPVAGQTTVTFGNGGQGPVAATNVIVAGNGLSLTCTAPAHAAGLLDIVVTAPGGVANSPNAFTYYDVPTISTVTPVDGPISGPPPPLTITITGTNFHAGLTIVTFGNGAQSPANATSVVVAPNHLSLTCTLPAHVAGIVDVVVTAPGGQVNSPGAFRFFNPPTIGTVTPDGGPLAGAITVTITGSNFSTLPGETSVTFGSAGQSPAAATGVVVAGGGASLTCTAPAHAAGLLDVLVTAPGGTAVLPNAFTYYGPPTVATVSPSAGPLVGGITVTITGTNFSPTSGATIVTFGSAIQSPAAATSVVVAAGGTSLTCTAPAHIAGAVDIVVQAPGGQVNSPAAFTYFSPPTLLTIVPPNGPSQGGTSVTITGTNFSTVPGQTTVTFGGALATNVVVAGGGGSLTCTSPAHDAGAVPVVVNAPGGPATSSPPGGGYTFVGPRILTINPNTGPAIGEQTVTITGSGFAAGATVSFGGSAPIAANVASATSLTVTTPAHAIGSVDVVLTVGADSATVTNGYSYLNPPTVTSIVLNRGPIGGGQTVTINGTNFAPSQTSVTIGGAAALITNTTATTITCTTPIGTAGPAVNVAVTTFTNPPVVLPSAYTYVNPPTISSILPNRGSTTPAGQTVTLTGTNFETGGQTSVSIDGIVRTPVVASATSLTFTTPVHLATGAVNVIVSTFTPPQPSAAATYTYVDSATTVDLALGMIPDTSTPSLNGNVTFTLTLSNTGTLNATGVTVMDLLPAGLNFVSATPSTGTYTSATGNWVVGTVNTGTSVTLALVAQVTSATSIVNSAQVTACTQPDIDSTVNVLLGEDDEASVTITAGLTIQTAAALPGATSGAFYYQQIVATGGAPVYQWSLTSAPGTLPFNLDPATGVISGTAPLAAATYAFTLTVSDSSAPATTASRLFSIIVSAPAPLASPTITTTPLPPAGIVQKPYSHTFTATGGPVPTWSVSVGALPAGLLLNTVTGQVAGTPTTVGGPVNFTMRATNANGFVDSPFSITIAANPITFITPSLPNGSIGSIYDQPVQISGGTGSSFTWSVVPGLPPGLTLTGTTRTATITGTPSNSAAFSFTVQVQDNSPGGLSASRLFTGQILSGAAPFAPALPAVPPVGTLGQAYFLSLTGAGGTRPYSWTLLSGSMPPGLTLNGGVGTITGTPTSAGSFQVTLRGNDSAVPNATANQTFTLTIAPAPVITTPSPLTSATNGVVYVMPLSVAGGVGPFTWAVTFSAPPTGLSLSSLSGVLGGTPAAPGTAIFDVRATDSNGAFVTKSFTLTVANPAGPLTILNGLPPALVGVPWSATIQATGGTAPYTFSLAPGSSLPVWATFDSATGTIYGTPDANPVTLQIRVTDSLAAFADSNALVVNTTLSITQVTLPSGNVGSGYATTLVTTGGSGTVIWTIVSGSLPNGLALNSVSGLISGTPQTNGASTFMVRAADSAGGIAQRQFTITIGGAIAVVGRKGGGGGCGLLGAEVLLLWMLRRVRRRRAQR